MSEQKKVLTAWGDDVALRGPDAPKNNGMLKHLIEYLLTVYERFGDTSVTTQLQWGASACWKRDEQAEKIAQLSTDLAEALAALREHLAAHEAQCPPFDAGLQEQNSWAQRKSDADKAARLLLSKHSKVRS